MLNRIYRVGHSLLHTNYLFKYLCSNYLISINTKFSSINISLLIEGATMSMAIKFIYHKKAKNIPPIIFKLVFCFFLMKKTLGFLCGIIFFRNFDDYPGFKPKITPTKHFSRQSTTGARTV